MGCGSPTRECFTWHVLPKLPGAKHKIGDDGQMDPWSVRVRCPAHEDHDPSMGVSVKAGRIVWHCFACENTLKVRMAMHHAYGIDLACLPIPAAEKQDILDYLADLLAADTKNHAEIRLRALAAIEGHRDLPRGAELGRLAGLARISHGAAWGFLKRKPPGVHR
jgi:hypothetical protein